MRYLEEPLKKYGILDETSFHVMRSVGGYRRALFYLDQMHYLMYILGKRENRLQILYRCLQHRFLRHRKIVEQLESKGEHNLVQHIFTTTQTAAIALEPLTTHPDEWAEPSHK